MSCIICGAEESRLALSGARAKHVKGPVKVVLVIKPSTLLAPPSKLIRASHILATTTQPLPPPSLHSN